MWVEKRREERETETDTETHREIGREQKSKGEREKLPNQIELPYLANGIWTLVSKLIEKSNLHA